MKAETVHTLSVLQYVTFATMSHRDSTFGNSAGPLRKFIKHQIILFFLNFCSENTDSREIELKFENIKKYIPTQHFNSKF